METPGAEKRQLIDEFVARSHELTGRIISEREPWNTIASPDAIRHYAYGTSDDNPLWLDEGYAHGAGFDSVLAPPAFLSSVLYPFLHGAPVEVPLISLIGEIEFEWFQRIVAGDALSASARQTGVTEAMDRDGRRLVYIHSETTYRNQRDEVVAVANGTMVRVGLSENDQLVDREVYRYSASELETIKQAIASETRSGSDGPVLAPRQGEEIPGRVRGPMTIGDLICWQAAIGPSYRAGTLGLRDALAAPHTAVPNPITGWPTKTSQQHEDFVLTPLRGMPAPFDNSLMRFAWIAPMITDWMGDRGFLKKLSIQTGRALLYGDTTWYSASVTDIRVNGDETLVALKIKGVNQHGETSTVGDAEVLIPRESTPRETRPSASRAAGHRTVDTGPSVLDAIELRVNVNPEAAAIRCGEHTLSYGEMDRRANRVAHILQSRGIGPGLVVALLLDRSVDAVVAMFAALKAGACFLPIDPEQPEHRIGAILRQARPALTVTRTHLASLARAALGAHHDVELAHSVILDEILEQAEAMPEEPPERTASAADPAYCMTTSGSVGSPRNVVVSHRSLGLYPGDLLGSLHVGAGDAYLHTASFSFSASIRQMIFPLSAGAALVIADTEERRNPLRTLELIKRERITIWDTVPAVWRFATEELLRLDPAARTDLLDNDLRVILSTGEALTWDIVEAWRNVMGHGADIINLYSQTETAGTVSAFRVPRSVPAQSGAVPLGDPLTSVAIHVLDDDLRPVVDGETGEVYVGGWRLADGYLHDPDLTHERFIDDPFSIEDGARLYRTGDRAIRQADGSIVFAGRSDHRVKIRGVRVELGEIESALAAIPGVHEAAVVVRATGGSDERLLAYVAPETDAELTPGELRARLRDTLPASWIPESFEVVSFLPRTSSGKIDRLALQDTGPAATARPHLESTASGRSEETVLAVFREVLDLDRVDPADNFFDLGGNSLTASRVLNKLRDRLGVDIDYRTFFEAETVGELARGLAGILELRSGG